VTTHDLRRWTSQAITAACRDAYRDYERRRRNQYTAYFVAHPELAGEHPLLARDLAAALPEGWSRLDALVPPNERHRWHLSGKSSQVLALGVLGVAMEREAKLGWTRAVGAPVPPSAGATAHLEYALAADVLDERPRVTAIDFLVDDPRFVLCAEAKWTEAGLGTCSCPDPAAGECAERVMERTAYWTVLREIFGLPVAERGRPCPLSTLYQAVRNVAAAVALAGEDREAVFTLLYDAENPYFAGCGGWPGWPAILAATLDEARPKLTFTAASWQDLMPRLPLDDATRFWAAEKHGID
jgi:hypothetical protein